MRILTKQASMKLTLFLAIVMANILKHHSLSHATEGPRTLLWVGEGQFGQRKGSSWSGTLGLCSSHFQRYGKAFLLKNVENCFRSKPIVSKDLIGYFTSVSSLRAWTGRHIVTCLFVCCWIRVLLTLIFAQARPFCFTKLRLQVTATISWHVSTNNMNQASQGLQSFNSFNSGRISTFFFFVFLCVFDDVYFLASFAIWVTGVSGGKPSLYSVVHSPMTWETFWSSYSKRPLTFWLRRPTGWSQQTLLMT